MNKREKAIWNIAIGVSVVVLFSFTYSLWGTTSSLNSKKKGFIKTLKKFEDYDIPTSSLLETILDNNSISIAKKKKISNKENTISSQKEFIEYKKVVSSNKDLKSFEKKHPFTSLIGFSIKGNEKWDEGENFDDKNKDGKWDEGEEFTDREEKIKSGCYLLTEISGKKFRKPSCSSHSLFIDNMSFFNDGIEVLGFENLNAFGAVVPGEEFVDSGNGKWDEGEEFADAGNGQYDLGEEFLDSGNGKWDEGEEFTDAGNGQYDLGEEFADKNDNGIWDQGDPYTDLNRNNSYDIREDFEDTNKNGKWDEGEGFKDTNNNKKWDQGDSYEDLDRNGTYTYPEKFTDEPDGLWSGEKFIDLGNGKWDEGEEFTDAGNGQYDLGEKFIDLGNGQYDLGEKFVDQNDNDIWDFVLLNNLKATEEEALDAMTSNYFFSKVTDNYKKINIYIKTNQEIDEYRMEADCFECAISKLEESMNELEISLKNQREHEFVLPETLTDPTDLSNVVILPGYEGGYNQSARRNTPRLSLIAYKGEGNSSNSYVSIDYKGHNYILKENDRLEDDGIVVKINKDYVEYKKDSETKILKLENK